jgi:hypothetical protein
LRLPATFRAIFRSWTSATEPSSPATPSSA